MTQKRENTSAVTALQVKALQKRLDAMRSRYMRVMSDRVKPKEPARVTKARAIVRAFDDAANIKGDEAYMNARAYMKLIEDEILFGDMARARAMLDDIAELIADGR